MSAFPWDDYKSQGDGDRPPIHKWPDQPDDPANVPVIGRITEVWAYNDKTKGTSTPVLNIEGDAGEVVSVWASQVLLRDALAAENPQVGDRIRIKFTGRQPTKSGSGVMKVFEVTVRRAEQGGLDGVPGPVEPPAESVPSDPVPVANYDDLGEEPFGSEPF